MEFYLIYLPNFVTSGSWSASAKNRYSCTIIKKCLLNHWKHKYPVKKKRAWTLSLRLRKDRFRTTPRRNRNKKRMSTNIVYVSHSNIYVLICPFFCHWFSFIARKYKFYIQLWLSLYILVTFLNRFP